MSPAPKLGRVDTAATSACLGAVFFWALGPIFIKYLTGHMDSWTQNALRYSAACLFWLPFVVHVTWRGAFPRRAWRRALVPALANMAMQSLWGAGFYYISPAFMTLLTNTSVLWVMGFSLLLFPQERPLMRSPRFWLGLALSLTGVLGVLYFKKDFAAVGTWVGVAIALAEAFMWGVYAISVKIALRDIDSRTGFSVISLYTTVGLWICAVLVGRPQQALHLGLEAWAAVVVSAITAIALAHVLFYAAIRRIGTTIPTLLVLTQPFIVFSMSSVIFHEQLNAMQLLAGGILLIGSASSISAQQHLHDRRPGG
ncbi:MAG: DMT family transporter [Planctomycetes bacterium]|jgi:drug/metabolite transporter (DMT)-like permease|nr:DMT family transporter [Planctomycetota bacterium]